MERTLVETINTIKQLLKNKDDIVTELGDKENNDKCDYCRIDFNTQDELNYHINNTHVANHKCIQCGIDFRTQDSLKYHFNDIHIVANHNCKQCGIVLTSKRRKS